MTTASTGLKRRLRCSFFPYYF